MRTTHAADRNRAEAETETAAAQSLGQPRRVNRARLRGKVDLEMGRASRDARSALHRLRAGERVDRDQRRGAQQCQRVAKITVERIPEEDGGAGGFVAGFWDSTFADGHFRVALG